jgi:AsmA protein
MRRVLLIVGVLAAGILLLALTLPFLIDVNRFRPEIEAQLTKSLGRTVKIGSLNLNILSGKVTATDISVADDPAFGQAPFLSTKALTLSTDLWQFLFSRKLSIGGMTIESPETVLIQIPSGTWNFSSLGAKSGTPSQPAPSGSGNLDLSMKSLKINNARLSLTQGRGGPQILENVSIEVKDFDPAQSFPFSVSAKVPGEGTVELEGKAGPIDQANAANTPLTATVKVANLSLTGSGAVSKVSGIDGILSLEGNISSNGHTTEVSGTAKIDRLKLAPGATAAKDPLTVTFALSDDLAQRSGRMTRGDIAIGSVKAALTGTWAGDQPVLKMSLAAPSVPVSGLERLLPVLDIVLPAGSSPEGGTASANLAIDGPAAAATISGPVTVRDTRLKGFDLGNKMSPIEKLAGIKSGPDTEIQQLSADVRVAPNGTSIQNLHLIVPAIGQMTGSGTISPAKALDFKMRASLKTGGVVSLVAPANIPFAIQGTTSNPEFKPDVGQLAAAELTHGVSGLKVGGVDAGKAAGDLVQGIFGKKKH